MMMLDKYGEREKFFRSGQLERKYNSFTDWTHSCSVGGSWMIAQTSIICAKSPGDWFRALDGP